jgi:hypothetical protein
MAKANNTYKDLAVWETAVGEVDKTGGQEFFRLRRYTWTDNDDPSRTGTKFILQNIYRKKDKKEIRKDFLRIRDDPTVLTGLSTMLNQGAGGAGLDAKAAKKAKKASK